MGFTLAHPAIIALVPKKNRKSLHLFAFILGTMSPDFLFFVYGMPFGSIGHSPIGWFIINLPLIYLIIYIEKRCNIISSINRSQLITIKKGSLEEWLENGFNHKKIIFSSIFGMITHLLWDEITHESSLLANFFPFLKSEFFLFSIIRITIADLLQYLTSILGLIILLKILNKFVVKIHWKIHHVAFLIMYGILFSSLFLYWLSIDESWTILDLEKDLIRAIDCALISGAFVYIYHKLGKPH